MYDSARELDRQPVRDGVCEQSASDSQFEVGGATSDEDIVRNVSLRAPLDVVAES